MREIHFALFFPPLTHHVSHLTIQCTHSCNPCNFAILVTSHLHASRPPLEPNRTIPNHSEPRKFFSCESPPFLTGLIRHQLQLIAPTYAKLRQKIFCAKCNSLNIWSSLERSNEQSVRTLGTLGTPAGRLLARLHLNQKSKIKNPTRQLPIAHARGQP